MRRPAFVALNADGTACLQEVSSFADLGADCRQRVLLRRADVGLPTQSLDENTPTLRPAKRYFGHATLAVCVFLYR